MALVEMKLTGLDGVLDLLHSLPAEVVSKKGGPVKAALKAGARVILNQAKANLQNVTNNATASGKKESTGFLLQNVVATRGKPPSDGNGERYLVRVLKKSYARKGKKVTTAKTASNLEYGTSKQPAEPWMNPAVAQKGEEAIRTIERELLSGIDAIVKKLGR